MAYFTSSIANRVYSRVIFRRKHMDSPFGIRYHGLDEKVKASIAQW